MGRRPGCSAGADRWILMTSPGSDFTYVCLVTVLPPSSLVMGFASAGLKSRQCLVLNQHLHAVPPAVSIQPRGEARQKALCSTLSNLDFTPGALGSHCFRKAGLVRRRRQGSGTSTGAGRASGGDSEVDHAVAVGMRRSG